MGLVSLTWRTSKSVSGVGNDSDRVEEIRSSLVASLEISSNDSVSHSSNLDLILRSCTPDIREEIRASSFNFSLL